MGSKEENEKQKKIFGKNLTLLVESKYPMQQKDIAKELGEYPTTFNTWCMGKSMPSMGKVQKIADYFGVGKSYLLDERTQTEKAESYGSLVAGIIRDEDMMQILEYSKKLQPTQRKQVADYIKFLLQSSESEGK